MRKNRLKKNHKKKIKRQNKKKRLRQIWCSIYMALNGDFYTTQLRKPPCKGKILTAFTLNSLIARKYRVIGYTYTGKKYLAFCLPI